MYINVIHALYALPSSRIRNMVDQRRHLAYERRKAAQQTKLQKEQITKVMEEVRTNATKANKIITQALSGKITLESLTSSSSSSSSSLKRSKSAKKDRVIPAEQVGLGRQSKSAGNIDLEFENEMQNSPDKKLYSEPFIPTNSMPQPYKSPYEGTNTMKE